jgi:hypothetical protein
VPRAVEPHDHDQVAPRVDHGRGRAETAALAFGKCGVHHTPGIFKRDECGHLRSSLFCD